MFLNPLTFSISFIITCIYFTPFLLLKFWSNLFKKEKFDPLHMWHMVLFISVLISIMIQWHLLFEIWTFIWFIVFYFISVVGSSIIFKNYSEKIHQDNIKKDIRCFLSISVILTLILILCWAILGWASL